MTHQGPANGPAPGRTPQTGGSLDACEVALQRGWAINLGGGFHHASAGGGGGFCVYADIGLMIQYLRRFHPAAARRVAIIDLDAHQVRLPRACAGDVRAAEPRRPARRGTGTSGTGATIPTCSFWTSTTRPTTPATRKRRRGSGWMSPSPPKTRLPATLRCSGRAFCPHSPNSSPRSSCTTRVRAGALGRWGQPLYRLPGTLTASSTVSGRIGLAGGGPAGRIAPHAQGIGPPRRNGLSRRPVRGERSSAHRHAPLWCVLIPRWGGRGEGQHEPTLPLSCAAAAGRAQGGTSPPLPRRSQHRWRTSARRVEWQGGTYATCRPPRSPVLGKEEVVRGRRYDLYCMEDSLALDGDLDPPPFLDPRLHKPLHLALVRLHVGPARSEGWG